MRAIRGRDPRALVSRLAPNHHLYEPGSWRDCRRYGFHWRVDVSDLVGWYLYFGFRDPSLESLVSLARPGDVVMDVGANLGVTSLRLSAAVGEPGRVFAFEPYAPTRERLDEHVRRNGRSNVTVVGRALGARAETRGIRVRDGANLGMNALTRPGEGDVAVETLDQFVTRERLARVDLVKIDTEGFEYDVLEGSVSTLARFSPTLFVELGDRNLAAYGRSARELVALLESRGYACIAALSGSPVRAQDDLTGVHIDVIGRPAALR